VWASERISAGLRTPPGYPEPMADRLRVACVQLNAKDSKAENIERAGALVARVASTGADLVLLPEKWNGFGRPDFMRSIAETLEDGETFEAMSSWARAHGITLVGGSIVERREGHEKLSNTCVVFDPEGDAAAVYRKIHMFDVDVGGHTYRESETEEPGDRPVTCEVEGWKLGLTICYDLRFPELYRILAVEGCTAVTVPAAFTLFTGKDHWELLLRARAVENQCYVIAANQWGTFAEGKAAFGRSSIVDPWGVVLAQAPDEDGVISAELDLARLDEIRRSVPSLANRQPAAYTWPAEV
jgi:deaminated glutathione amidase